MMWDMRGRAVSANPIAIPQGERNREHRHHHRERSSSRSRGMAIPAYSSVPGQSGNPTAFPQPFIPMGGPGGPTMPSYAEPMAPSYAIPRAPTGYSPESFTFPTQLRGPDGYESDYSRYPAIPRSAPPRSGTPAPPAPAPGPRPRHNSGGSYYPRSQARTAHHHPHKQSHSHSHSRTRHNSHPSPAPVQHVLHTSQSQNILRSKHSPHVVFAPGTQQGHHGMRPSHSQNQIVQAMESLSVVPKFQYSKCTGRRKALCIGINYRGSRHELKGCINDANNVRDFLMRNHKYKSGDIVMLTDDHNNPRSMPTRRNILDAMRWLVSGARTHDALFFHYSGHGGQTKDLNGDEIDGYDEVIYPVDFQQRGQIIDDDMNDIMVKPLPIGCRLTAVFDSCHSGTVLDLPYVYHSDGRLKGRHITDAARASKATPADVVSFCGCRDDQTSADTFEGGAAVGAMSHAFITVMKQSQNLTYAQLLKAVRDILRSRYSQKPQLSSSHPIDTKLTFII